MKTHDPRQPDAGADRASSRDGQRGQVLVLFVFMVTAMLFMAALLFDAAQLLVNRRVLQNAADAGAIAGANLVQTGSKGCSGRADVANAATAAAQGNLVGVSLNGTPQIQVTCPSGYENNAVRVTISSSSMSFFSPFLNSAWQSGIPVNATGTAMHGPAPGNKFSVVELNPHNPGWHSSLRGCPSVLFSGNPTVIFEGSLHANSACPASSGGAMGTNGGPTLQFVNGARASLTGGFSPGSMIVSPPPLTDQPRLRDPLRNLPPMPGLPVVSNSRKTINGTVEILYPGVYRGGIRLLSTAQAFLLPGIYVLEGGGLDVGSQASVFSIPVSLAGLALPTHRDTWSSDCAVSSCGVLLYNKSGAGGMGQIAVGAGATVLLRPYNPGADWNGTNVQEYRNLLIWQDANPVPTSNSIQPQVNLTGGGKIDISGTLYTPSAKVFMTGGSGGSGGDATSLTLQFITWDLQIQGNSSFHFIYRTDNFARPVQYGLVE